MKALSIRQPWLHALMELGKRVENRDWAGCSYRGPVLLHASSRVVLRPTKRDPETFGDGVNRILEIVMPAPGTERLKLLEPLATFSPTPMARRARQFFGAEAGAPGDGIWRPAPPLPLGGIVGRARIVDTGRVAETGHVWDDRRPLWCKLGCGGVWGVAYDRFHACPKASPWAVEGALALVLADVEPVPFIPSKGSLGFFDVPDEVISGAQRDQRPRPCTHVGACGCASLADL